MNRQHITFITFSSPATYHILFCEKCVKKFFRQRKAINLTCVLIKDTTIQEKMKHSRFCRKCGAGIQSWHLQRLKHGSARAPTCMCKTSRASHLGVHWNFISFLLCSLGQLTFSKQVCRKGWLHSAFCYFHVEYLHTWLSYPRGHSCGQCLV